MNLNMYPILYNIWEHCSLGKGNRAPLGLTTPYLTKASYRKRISEFGDEKCCFLMLFSPICEIGGLAIIHKRVLPDLATGQLVKLVDI